ncbi:DUF6894 family protein [Sphingomonas endolithica]|uniref:DUF6894 family protein n=1 Tax=Sphingomonas endolithica TaxID=2972485 RepID=UPI0021AFC555|nr:hypothetical protein [Sphingomonas sp. ZFBP2030]
MARLFFELNECGTVTGDVEGQEVADLDAARAKAIAAARDIMAAEVLSGKLCLSCNIRVTDRDGETLLLIPFKDAVTVSGM